MDKNQNTSLSIRQEILNIIPVYPREIRHGDICKAVNITSPNLAKFFLSLTNNILVCESGDGRYCYESRRAKEITLKEVKVNA